MNNKEIIEKIAIMIYGEDKVKKMIQNGEEIPIHTKRGWTNKGPFRIKEGQQGIKTNLWKRRKNGDFYLAKAILFTIDQIEEIEE